MDRKFTLFFTVVVSIVMGCFFAGCNSGSNNPVAVGDGLTMSSDNMAGPISFNIVLPEKPSRQADSTKSAISSIRRASATEPTVTFKLILVNVSNAGIPTSTIVKTVPVDTVSGSAEVTFTDVPAGPCIGDIHIEGGSIDSYTDFHGAVDLVAGSANTLFVAPKGSRMQQDFVAHVIEQIVISPLLLGKALPNLTYQVIQAIAGLDRTKDTAYTDAVNLYAKYTNVDVQIVTSNKTVVYNGNGNTGGSIPVDEKTYGPGETVVTSLNTGNLTKTGYTFNGWNTQADGLGSAYSAGATFQMGTTDVVLYASWIIYPVTGVTLNKETTALSVSASETLIAAVAPDTATNKAVTWSSSNTSVATVDDNGKVTGVAVGQATITVTTVDGSLTDTCVVTVQSPVALQGTVSGRALSEVLIKITGVAADFTTTTSLPDTASTPKTWVLSKDADLTTTHGALILRAQADSNGTAISLADGFKIFADFDSLTFTTDLPTGAQVFILNQGTDPATVVTQSDVL